MGEAAQVVESIPLLVSKYALSSSTLAGGTLYAGGEDGTLRVHQCREDPLSAVRPAFDAGNAIPQFSKKREAIGALCALPEWRALLSHTGAWCL